MTKTDYPVLCGGTFFTQILLSRKPTVSRRQRTQSVSDIFHEQDVLLGLILIVQPDYLKPAGDTFKTYTTYFKRCSENTPLDLQFADETVVSAFLSRFESDYADVLNEMTGFVSKFIEVGTTRQKDVKLVKKLIEMITSDIGTPAIPDSYRFDVSKDGATVTKNQLHSATLVYLPAFLLSVWKFIVTERKDNSIGAATVSAWSTHVKGRYNIPENSLVAQNLTVDCGEYIAPVDLTSATQDPAELVAVTVEKFIMPDVYAYLRNAENKYRTIKTLLDTDNPKPFYDFYVCNGIRYRTMNNRETRHPQNVCLIENATVAKIAQHTKFAIISGTGGLGKSMMMRHLMLNAIENFDDLKLFPIFVPLKDFDETAATLYDYTYSKIGVFDSSLNANQFEQILDHGSCLLLFDGLDEIGAGYTQRFERELEALTDKYSKNMFILSSRPFQSFVSFVRFSLLHLIPFTRRQAMQLVDSLEFRPDEPIIKKKFQAALEKMLFRTHRSFTENPLLLTIMLLTFEQFAEVPSKMHIFYREAFEVLAKRHDASKGAYKRALKTGLSVDAFADYFAELCFRSYNDEKFELTAEEFTGYYNNLNARVIANDKKTTVRDFLEDLCSNLCLMYYEGDRYHFTHRSFQEYFCALFFSKQKDKFIVKLGDFFERHQRRMYGDRTFYMLYDMITEKVEEYIFIPFLTSLFDKCEKADGYWTFLEEMYLHITYSSDDEYHYSLTRLLKPRSFIFSAVLDISGFRERGDSLNMLPYYESFEVERITRMRQQKIFNRHGEEIDIEENEEDVGYVCCFDVAEVRQHPEKYSELLDELNDEEFIFKKQYYAAHHYMKKLSEKQKIEDDSLLDLL